MFERLIAPVLTFAVLIAGHLVIASALFSAPAPADTAAVPVVQLEKVMITGKRVS